EAQDQAEGRVGAVEYVRQLLILKALVVRHVSVSPLETEGSPFQAPVAAEVPSPTSSDVREAGEALCRHAGIEIRDRPDVREDSEASADVADRLLAALGDIVHAEPRRDDMDRKGPTDAKRFLFVDQVGVQCQHREMEMTLDR